jgi:hypothetical protein
MKSDIKKRDEKNDQLTRELALATDVQKQNNEKEKKEKSQT